MLCGGGGLRSVGPQTGSAGARTDSILFQSGRVHFFTLHQTMPLKLYVLRSHLK